MDTFVRSLTATGKVVLLSGPLALFFAILSGWAEFSVLGVGCILSILVGMAWISRPQKLGVTRTLHPAKVTVGESAIGVVEVKNTTRRRIGPQFAEDVLGDEIVRLALPALAPDASIEQPYTVPAPKRGLFPVGPVRLTRSDPMGLFRREQGQGSIVELWVRPRVYPMSTVSSGWAKDLDGPTSDTAPRGSAAFHALREYQFGDDLRHVHWRTSARRNQLMVRHYVDTRRSEEAVLLDPRAEVYSGDAFEDAVEIAASISAAAHRDGRSVQLLLPNQPESARANRFDVLDRLTLVHQVTGASTDDGFSLARREASNASALIVVTGNADADELMQQARRVQRGLVVIVRVVPDVEPGFQNVRGGRVVNVPSANRAAGAWAEAVTRR